MVAVLTPRQRKLRRRRVAALGMVALAAVLLVAALGHGQDPPIDVGGLGKGRYATMRGTVEKTILQIDVMRVTIRFGTDTEARIEELAAGREHSDALEARIAKVAYRADHAYVRQVFLIDASLDQLVEGVLDNLEKAREAGMIDEASYRRVERGLRRWFSFLEERGVREGDQLLYRARPDSLRTVYLNQDGKELLDRTDQGSKRGTTLLSGFFAPGGDARGPLIESLFE